MEPDFLPDPAHGRLFTSTRIVRSTDVTPAGRLRFDALARYLQEAAEDDLAAAAWNEPYDWLLRRCAVTVRGYPLRGEQVSLRTYCSATGPRCVVVTNRRRLTPTRPAARIRRATRFCPTRSPASRRSRRIRGAP